MTSHRTDHIVRPRTVVAWRDLPLSTLGTVGLFCAFAIGLLFQAKRWYSTPAYGNLLIIFSAQTWGVVYLVIGALLVVWLAFRQIKLLGMIAHTLAFVLLVMWEAAFIIRWITDPKTTIANVVAWGFYIAVTLRSASVAAMDHDEAAPG